jgi:hypothetical protein
VKPPYTNDPGPWKSKWLSTDSKETFQKNWDDPNKRRILVSQGYNDPKAIVYEADESGFRIMPKVNDDSKLILALGDSNTFGVGLNVNSIWPLLLANDLDMNVLNAGVCGASIDNAFRIARDLIPELKPAAVFHLGTYEDRWEIISDFIFNGHPYQYGAWDFVDGKEGSWDSTSEEKKLLESFTKLTCNEVTTELHYEKNSLAIAQICCLNNIPYVEIPIKESGEDNYHPLARDLKHRGRDFHHDIAKLMYNKYKD